MNRSGHVTNTSAVSRPTKAVTTLSAWRERPFQTLNAAADIASLSVASLYRFESEGRLTFKRLGGRTLVDTVSLIALLETAESWTPSKRGSAAVAARVERARAAWSA